MRLSILGLGRMGIVAVRCLMEGGHEVTVYDADRERTLGMASSGATLAFTLRDALAEAQVALTLVDGDEALDALSTEPGGLVACLGHGAIHLCMSALSAEGSRRQEEAHRKAGQGYVAAAFLGRPSALGSKQSWVLAAGSDAEINRCLPVLQTLGHTISRAGTHPEVAHALKLGADALEAAAVAALAEVLAFGEKVGMPPGEFLRILNLGLFKSPWMDASGALMVRQDFDPSGNTLDQAAGTLARFGAEARVLGVPVPVAGEVLRDVEEARAHGLGGRDLTALSGACRLQAGLGEGAPPAPAAPRTRPERRRNATPRKSGEPERRRSGSHPREAHPPKAPEPPPVSVPVPPERPPQDPAKPSILKPVPNLADTALFEFRDGQVWAVPSEGEPRPTPWRSLDAVAEESAQVIFVKLDRKRLLNPMAVRSLEPLFGGRCEAVLGPGLTVKVGRAETRELRFLLGL
jgi:3-hydroxyisobutyrate dehydrogenase-like beta-hydroxyacid dehydrogenase